MTLVLPDRPTVARRLSGLGVSVPLHIVVVALLIASRPPSLELTALPTTPMKTVTSLVVPPTAPPSSGDRVLSEEHEMSAGDADDESVRVGGVNIDIVKVRARRTMLFPFLTLDLQFLEPLTEQVPEAARKLVNPFARGARRAPKQPLAMSDTAFQQVIDRSWSRRERWKAFSEIAALIGAHDANDGRVPALMRAYLDQNILQPFCDDDMRDPRFWAMLDNAADHADFIDFVRSFAREHPSSRTTTELLFLLDELAQGSRDALLMLLDTKPNVDLSHTARANREGYNLAVSIRQHYGKWLLDRDLDSSRAVSARYDDLRLRLLSTIIASTPDGYRAADARFLAGEILFKQGNVTDAERMWKAITPDARDSYALAYSQVLRELRETHGMSARTVSRLLQNEHGRWRLFNVDRLRQFGYSCSTF